MAYFVLKYLGLLGIMSAYVANIKRSLDPRKGKRDTAAPAREESARACPHSRRGLTPLERLQKYPEIYVGTGEETSGSGLSSRRGHMTHHRLERNLERRLATRMEVGLS